ncbi:clarin-3-like [Glandiceps talaboti]
MQPLRKGFCFLAAIVAVAGTVLIITGLATPRWVWSHVRQNKSTADEEDYGAHPQEGTIDRGHYLGTVFVGLFEATTHLNWGAGMRDLEYETFDYLVGVYNEGLWISIIVFCCLCIPFGITAAVAAFYNACVVPINMISGVFGLYIWNGVAALFSGVTMVLFIVEYYVNLIDGIVSVGDYDDNWRNEWVHFHYSFWLVVSAFCLFVINCAFVKIASLGEDPDLKIPRVTGQDNHQKGADVGLGLMY